MFPTKIFDLSQRRSGDRRHAATKALRLGQVAMRFSLTFPTSYALLACACLVFGFRLAARRTSDVQTLAETESCDEEVKEVLTEEDARESMKAVRRQGKARRIETLGSRTVKKEFYKRGREQKAGNWSR